ncbi:MAG: sensor histidine kinase [Chloroflexota bacterium]
MATQLQTEVKVLQHEAGWLVPTTAGSVTLVVGVLCVAALVFQSIFDAHVLNIPQLAFVVAVIVGLVGLDRFVHQRFGELPPRSIALTSLLLHFFLIELVMWFDGFNYTSILYLAIPFPAFFMFGRIVGLGVTAGLLVWFTAKYLMLKPGWLSDPVSINNYLLFLITLMLVAITAQVIQRERAQRRRTETLLEDLETSHEQLAESHRELAHYAQQVAEMAMIEERNRLARDIHDSLGHYLTVIGIQLEKALTLHADSPDETLTSVQNAKRMTDQALTDVRQSVSTLRHDQAPFVLRPALEKLIANLDYLPFKIQLSIVGDETRFSKQQLMAIYRAIQEGLTNIHKHAQARHVQINLDFAEQEAMLVLKDDGVGIQHQDAPPKGFGLRGVKERLELVNGRLLIQSQPNLGTQLHITIAKMSTFAG